MQNNIDNGWYERGEFPPVGTKCQVKCRNIWVDVIITKHIFVNDCVAVFCESISESLWGTRVESFRPVIEKSREKSISKVMMICFRDKELLPKDFCSYVIGKIYDAGLLKLGD